MRQYHCLSWKMFVSVVLCSYRKVVLLLLVLFIQYLVTTKSFFSSVRFIQC